MFKKARKRGKAKKKCKQFFFAQTALFKGCKAWVSTLENPDSFETPEQYTATLPSELFINLYGYDNRKDDAVTLKTIQGESSPLPPELFYLAAVIVLILIINFIIK